MNKLKKYFKLYQQFFIFNLNAIMAYKVNFMVQSLYAPAYVLVMYSLVRIAYTINPVVAGWKQDEGYLLFLVFHFLFTCSFVLFLKGVRQFLYFEIRQGRLDIYLTKPVDSQFLTFFTKPEVEQVLLLIGLLVLLIAQIFSMSDTISAASVLAFIPMFLLGLIVIYGTISLYASLAFYLVRASQIFEIFMKTSDFGQYPLPLFPLSFQAVAVTIIPIAFFSYVPTIFLLGKGTWLWAAITLLVAVGSVIASKTTWQYCLRQYSSASS